MNIVFFGHRRLREYNDCNLPAGQSDGGRFGSNDDPRCKGGARAAGQRPYRTADDASPERSIYGASALDDDATFAYSADDQTPILAAFADRRLDGAEVKQEIAAALGKQFEQHASPEQIDGLYKALEDRILHVVKDLGSKQELSSNLEGIERFAKVDAAPNPDTDAMRRGYEAFLDEVEAKERDAVFQQNVRAWAQEVPLERSASETTRMLPVVSNQLLVWLSVGLGDSDTPGTTPEQVNAVRAALSALSQDKAFQAYAVDAVHKKVAGEASPDFSEHYEKLGPLFAQVERGVQAIPGLTQASLTAGVNLFSGDLQAAIHDRITGTSIGEAMTAGAAKRGKERRAEHEQYGFDNWYEDNHGVTPQQFRDWREASNRGGLPTAIQAEAVATVLIKQWAMSSGDDHRDSIALQMAAGAEFGLPSAYTGRLKKGKEASRDLQGARKLFAAHEPALRGFIRGMYTHTQQQLDTLYPDSDHVTLYRGFSMPLQLPDPKVVAFLGPPPGGFQRDPGAYAINPRGSLVDVNLQPASSFSVSPLTAGGFGSNVFTVRVPKARILSTALTGFGCLSETEVVVLGGRATGVVTDLDEFNKRALDAVQGSSAFKNAYGSSGASVLGHEAYRAQLASQAAATYATKVAREQRRAMGFYEKGSKA